MFAEHQLIAFLHPLGIADEGLPAPEVDTLVQGRANLGLTARAPPFELGRDDAGIVEDQHVARFEQVRQVAHAPVFKRRISAANNQHPRRITRAHRTQGNAFLRQIEIEQINLHGRGA